MSSIKGYEWKSIEDILKETPPLEAQDTIDEKYPGAWGLWCRWQWMVTLSGMIDDAVIVVHGPEGCQASGRVFHGIHFEENFGLPFLHIPSTSMKNTQVIMGGEEELKDTIINVDRIYKPPLIIVHSNCCAGLNMDDIKMVVSSLKPKINAKLIYIPSEGFACTWTGSVAELNVPLYVELMDEPQNIDPKKVNIVGLYKDIIDTGPEIPPDRNFKLKYQNNASELKRIIEGIGLKLHRALFGGNYEYFRKAPEAYVNVIDCPCWGYPLAKAMKERFGTPFMRHAKPIGVDSTIKWIRELAEFTDVKNEAESFMNIEYDEIKDVWEEAKRLAKGKIALIDGSRGGGASVTRPLAQSRFCMELGMTPYIILIHPLAIKAKEETIRYFLGEGINPLALVGPYHHQKSPYREENVIKDLGVDLHDVVYFHNDAFAYAKAETWDPSNVACVSNAGQPFRRTKCGPRDVGFRGAKGMAIDLINAIKAAERGIKESIRRPTLYGRMMRGKSFDFELKEGESI